MSLVLMEPHGKVALLRLNNGVTNAINPDLISELADRLEDVRTQFRGLILAGGDKFFSIGFDLPVLLGLERVAMTDFFNGFNKLAFDLYTLEQPTASAMVGHTIAGGSILALTTDYRFAAQGKKQIGLNEIKLGIPVPCLADLILRQLVGDRVATEMIFSGEFMTMSEAQGTGLVDDTFLAESLEEQAILKISELSAFDPNAFASVKASRVEQVRIQYQQLYEARNQRFIDAWFNAAVQEKLERAAKQF